MGQFHFIFFPLLFCPSLCVNVVQRALGNYFVYEAAFDEIISIWESFLLVEMYVVSR